MSLYMGYFIPYRDLKLQELIGEGELLNCVESIGFVLLEFGMNSVLMLRELS